MKRKLFSIALVFCSATACATLHAQTPPSTAATTAPTTMPDAPYAPAELPGKGLSQHPFMYAGEAQPLTVYVVRDGKIAWSYVHPGKGEISDATQLSNGNIVFAYQFGALEITPDKKIIWSRPADPGCEIHTASPIGTDRVLFVQNGDPAKLFVVNIVTGITEKEFVLPTSFPKMVHGHFRHARYTPAGTFLVAHMDMGKVSEYDSDGKEIWSYKTIRPWSAARLKNGNTLIATNRTTVVEVNPKGEIVWQLTQKDIPDFRIFDVQTVGRLENGNTIINNWHGKNKNNPPVQILEITPDKKVVWALSAWDAPADLGRATNIQLLDEPGKAENAELQR